MVLLVRVLAGLLFCLVFTLVVRELVLQRAAARAVRTLDELLRVVEQKHGLCLGVSCHRFGVLTKDLELLFYEIGVRLTVCRRKILNLAAFSTILPSSRAKLLQRAEFFLNDLTRIEADLDSIGRFHAGELGWTVSGNEPEPWQALLRANDEIRGRTTGRREITGPGY